MAKYGATSEEVKREPSSSGRCAALIVAAIVVFAVAHVSGVVKTAPTGALYGMGPKKKVVKGVAAPAKITAGAMTPDTGLDFPTTETEPDEPTVSAGWNEDKTSYTISTDQPRKKEPKISGPTLNGEPWSPPGKTRDPGPAEDPGCNFDGKWKSQKQFGLGELWIEDGQVIINGIEDYPFTTGVTADGDCICTLHLDAQTKATGFLHENTIRWGPDVLKLDVWTRETRDPGPAEVQDACLFDGKWKSTYTFVYAEITIGGGNVNIDGTSYPFTTGEEDDGNCNLSFQLDAQKTAEGVLFPDGDIVWFEVLNGDIWTRQN